MLILCHQRHAVNPQPRTARFTTCCTLLLLAAAPARAFQIGDLPGVRCVCNYLFGEEAHDPATWAKDLEAIKGAGFNAVWMVHVWADYQPDVNSADWREDRVAALKAICAAACARDMRVILPLAYIGEGWGPQGVDAPVWPLMEAHRQQHLAFLRRMAKETREFDNVIYLLCTEEILPATLLYEPEKRQECVASFREWARAANPDVSHWNERWGTEYSWETLTPADIKHRPRWQLWADHARWHGWLMRRLLPPMVVAIREGNRAAVVGFHDFLMPMGLDLTVADGGLPFPSPVDFYSIGYYYDHGLKGGVEENLAELSKRVERARELYPSLPLFCGELGMDPVKQPPEVRARDEALQAEFLLRATDYLREQRVGFDLWCWRTVVENAPRTHALIREDGTETPALQALRQIWTRHQG